MPVTAILTFRNAGLTLAAALDHLHALGCAVIAIDHGSTDDSREIAAGYPLAGLIDEPWTGSFDLQRQLRLKARVIAGLSSTWVLHADADEFLDPPAGRSLADCLAEADAGGRIAFPCDERLFLPAFEDEEHDPHTFQATLAASVPMQERDPKQRLFRREADLGLWFRTGGHTVTRDPARLADTRLILRHYPGLSLDDLRGQYLSRVFAPDDQARRWHSNRMAARAFDIVEPDPALWQSEGPCTTLPFLTRRPPEVPTALPEEADLFLLSDRSDPGIAARITTLLPGLRVAAVAATDLNAMRRTVPVMHVLSHPAGLHGRGVQRSQERARAIAWTRRIALARQWALDRDAVYAEVQFERLDQPGLLADRLAGLWQQPLLRGAAGFLAPESTPIRCAPWANPVRAITGPLAADLGYR